MLMYPTSRPGNLSAFFPYLWLTKNRCKPRDDAIIFHIDVDPLKQQMPVFYVSAQKRYRADASTALKQINEYITSITPTITIADVRAAQLDAEFEAREKALKIAEELEWPNDQISTHYLMGQLREKLKDKNPLWLIEAVTMTGIVFDHLKPTECGSVINSGAGGRTYLISRYPGNRLTSELRGYLRIPN